MSFVCVIQPEDFGVPDLFVPSRLPALRDKGRLHANGEVLIPLSRKMNANNLERELLRFTSVCEVDPLEALLNFARSNEIDWPVPKASGRYWYTLVSAMIIVAPKQMAVGCKRGRLDETLFSTA